MQHIKNQCNKNLTNQFSSSHNVINNNPVQLLDKSENNIYPTKIYVPSEYLTKSRYILLLSEQVIRANWPQLPQRATPIIETILNQPIEFDSGTSKKKYQISFSCYNFSY